MKTSGDKLENDGLRGSLGLFGHFSECVFCNGLGTAERISNNLQVHSPADRGINWAFPADFFLKQLVYPRGIRKGLTQPVKSGKTVAQLIILRNLYPPYTSCI